MEPILSRGLSDATSMIRNGRLAEATELIQQSLARTDGPGSATRREGLASLLREKLPSRGPSPAVPGMERHTIKTSAGERSYLVHIPAGLPATAPLVVMLHGGTQDGTSFAVATRMNQLADDRGFVVVYPEQSRSANPMGYWNWFRTKDQQRGQGEPSILAAVIQQMRTDLAVSRVVVVGFSAGAAMASVMGVLYPDLVDGIGVVAGLAHGAAHDVQSGLAAMKQAPHPRAAGSMQVIVIHGAADATVHLSNADAVINQFVPNQRETEIERGHDGKSFTRTTFVSQGREIGQRWIIDGLGHAWSGGRPGGSYTDPVGPDTSALILDFLLSPRS